MPRALTASLLNGTNAVVAVEGDSVQLWIRSESRWADGTVDEILEETLEVKEGCLAPAGSVRGSWVSHNKANKPNRM